jgi:hypothetical protein
LRSGRSTSHRLTVWGAVLLALLGMALLVLAFLRPPSPPETPAGGTEAREPSGQSSQQRSALAGEGRPGGEGHAGIEDLITGPVLPASRPTSVSIPRLHVTSRLVRLGTDDGGAMEVPADPATAGWYRLGPTPGALGPAVIAGHVTWNQAPAVFFRLATLRAGDTVRVTREDRTVAVFEVTRVARYPKSRFPTRAVFGGIDHAGLRLITCGGEFDSTARSYRDNVVAFAELVSGRPTGDAKTP